MDTTSGLLTYLGQRFGTGGLMLVAVAAVTVAVVAGLTIIAVSELVGASVDPVQVAPVRWIRRL